MRGDVRDGIYPVLEHRCHEQTGELLPSSNDDIPCLWAYLVDDLQRLCISGLLQCLFVTGEKWGLSDLSGAQETGEPSALLLDLIFEGTDDILRSHLLPHSLDVVVADSIHDVNV